MSSALRNAKAYTLTVDATLRSLVLPAGTWRLYGSTTQVYGTTRLCDSDGTVRDDETEAPSSVAAPTAGTPNAGALVTLTGGTPGTVGGFPLPAVATSYVELVVGPGTYEKLYLMAGGGTTVVLAGPGL